MEIKVKQSDLSKYLGLLQSVVERKTTMPILTNVLIETKEKGITLCATDLEIGMTCHIQAEIISSGKIALHAKSLYDIIKEMPNNLISMEVGNSNVVSIVCGEAKFKVSGLPTDDFPQLPKVEGGKLESVNAAMLRDMLDKTSFAMSNDESRYNLNGISLEKINNGIRMISTDGHRLSIVEREMSVNWNLGSRNSIIIPRKGINELKKVIEGAETIDMLVADKYIVAKREGVSLVIRLIDGQFPPYLNAIPKQSKRNVTLERGSIVRSLKLVSALANEMGRGVKFSFSPKNLELLFSNPDVGEARDNLEIEYKGDSFSVGFNGKYFLDAISVLPDEKILLDLGDETAPCIVKAASDKGFTHIIMPMRI